MLISCLSFGRNRATRGFTALGCSLCLGLLFLSSVIAQAQTISRHKLTASYLYNFAKHIEWPHESGLDSFDIALYGNDTQQVYAELAQLAGKVKLRNLPIRVERVTNTSNLVRYQMVYLDAEGGRVLPELLDALESKPVLLVTADYPNQQLVMINLLSSNDRLLFEVNRSNIINHGLKPLPELILNGGTEIDVARLYREGQASLVAMQKQLQAREKTLRQLSDKTEEQAALNRRLEQQLAELNQNIRQSDALIANQNLQLQEQEAQLEKNKQERTALLQEMDERTRELNAQKVQLQTISTTIETREKRLTQLDETIRVQEAEIAAQKRAIAGLDETVDAQKTTLRYMLGLVILGVLLIFTIFVAYHMKRRDNQRLAAHSKDLQIAKDRLAIAKRKAEDASQAKSEFLSLMSHELRTPLQAIIGYTELVIEELKLDSDDRHVKDLERVIHNGERLLRLINGVLDMAKIESGSMDLDLTEVRLSSLVDEARGTVAPLLEKSEIQVVQEVDDGESLPKADPEKLLHILINLLGNASKFAPKGVVSIKAYHRAEKIYISVADTGIGMSPEQQQHIFDPFRQADSGTTRKYQGSGLGLSITRQLCELMGGSIRVESELGKGSTFIVELPLPIVPPAPKDQEPEAVITETAAVMPAGADESLTHLVIVEEYPQLLERLARGLGNRSYQLHCASDVASCLQLVREHQPQAVVIDPLFAPASSVIDALRADPQTAGVTILLLSPAQGADLLPYQETQLLLAQLCAKN